MEVDARPEDGLPSARRASSSTPFPVSLDCPPADAFHTPHPCMLKPGIQTVLNVCLWL